jgi:hypothetical protein
MHAAGRSGFRVLQSEEELVLAGFESDLPLPESPLPEPDEDPESEPLEEDESAPEESDELDDPPLEPFAAAAACLALLAERVP